MIASNVILERGWPTVSERPRDIKDSRLAGQNPTQDIPIQFTQNCFETMGLSVNIAPDLGHLRTTHPSKLAWVVPVGLGMFTGGGLETPQLNRRFIMEAGVGIPVYTTDPVRIVPFEGERYELQFFMPDMED